MVEIVERRAQAERPQTVQKQPPNSGYKPKFIQKALDERASRPTVNPPVFSASAVTGERNSSTKRSVKKLKTSKSSKKSPSYKASSSTYRSPVTGP